jgi:hypothetical protein
VLNALSSSDHPNKSAAYKRYYRVLFSFLRISSPKEANRLWA